jgi:hypothetical protein
MSLDVRTITHDMRHAAESANQGYPINPRWGLEAQTVYRGIWHAKHGHHPVGPTLKPESAVNHQPPHHPTAASSLITSRPVQAWFIQFLDRDEYVLMLFPPQYTTAELLLMIKQLNPDRPFHLQPLKHGYFPLPNPDLTSIRTLFAQDPRHITHTGDVKLERYDPPDPHSCSTPST